MQYNPEPTAPITIKSLIARLNDQLDEETVVIADIGDSLFAATELVIQGRTEFLSPAYYTSMGFSIPAAKTKTAEERATKATSLLPISLAARGINTMVPIGLPTAAFTVATSPIY